MTVARFLLNDDHPSIAFLHRTIASRLTFYLCRWRSDSWHPMSAAGLYQRQKSTNGKRQREDETAFEDDRCVRRGGVCPWLRRHVDACGGGEKYRLLPDRHHFGNARLRIYQPRTMPLDVFRAGRCGVCTRNPFPSGSASNASNTTGNGNSYAYQPKHSVSKRTRKPVEDR